MSDHQPPNSQNLPRFFQAMSKCKRLANRVLGIPLGTDLSAYWKVIREIKSPNLEEVPDRVIRERSSDLIEKARSGVLPEVLLNQAFALVREASRRTIGLKPFDVQVIAGLAMVQGKIAEFPTGEGKTLAAVFPAYLYALTGRGVHVLTFNDYLARRDAAWMGPAYEFLGLTVGCIQEGMSGSEKRKAYACDVTYATAKEAGFDFLRDGICYQKEEHVHRPFYLALVDEADSILIDEARVPLVISGIEEKAGWDVRRLAEVIKTLTLRVDYKTDAEHRNVFLTDLGQAHLEARLNCGSLYDSTNQRLLGAVYCALHAEALLRRDVDYIVRNEQIEIVDEFTGRVMDNRHWPDGLQAAVEAKENVPPKTEGRILGSITLQHFFRLYPRLCGMTATARPSAGELQEFYGLNVVAVPPNSPSIRVDHPDVIFTHKEAKRRALVREIRDVHHSGRPILVGTSSVKESEELAEELQEAGISCYVLNAKNDELEARIIAQAGTPGAVTISTNMAGRGTDIKLGGADEQERDRVVGLGGLYVIGTNRHESLRIDQQLRGRAGRQGDPGSTRFFISLEDDLFARYGLSRVFYERHRVRPQPEALHYGPLNEKIEHAQRIIEGQNFDIRKSLWNYSSLVEIQRQAIQAWRERVLFREGPFEVLSKKAPELYAQGLIRWGRSQMDNLERRLTIWHIDRSWADHLAWISDTRESIHLVSLGGLTPLGEFQKAATAAFLAIKNRVEDEITAAFEALITREGPVDPNLEGLKGPSSTWTYLVNEDQFGWGIEMLGGKNIGFAAGAAALYNGPLFILALLLNRVFKRKKGRRDLGAQGRENPPGDEKEPNRQA
jgi:preprotein translocase subunit SecA